MTFHKIYLIEFLTFSKLLCFMTNHFLKLSFTPCKTEQPLRWMKLQDKEIKDDNHRGELLSISTCFLQTKMVQKYCRNIVEIKISNIHCKQQKQLWILFYKFWKIPKRTLAVKFSVKLLFANMGFVNYSGLKFFPDFQNKEVAF